MIYLYYSDSKEKDLVDGWAKYGTTSNTGKLRVDYSDTITQGTTSSLYPWNYQTNPIQLETKHRKVKQIIKFKPI